MRRSPPSSAPSPSGRASTSRRSSPRKTTCAMRTPLHRRLQSLGQLVRGTCLLRVAWRPVAERGRVGARRNRRRTASRRGAGRSGVPGADPRVVRADDAGRPPRHRRRAERVGVRDLHGLVWEWVEDFTAALVTSDSRDPTRSRVCGAEAAAERIRAPMRRSCALPFADP